MQVNLFNRPLQSFNVQDQHDEAHNISLEKNLKTLDKAQAELSKIDKKIASLNKQSASVETLAMLAAQQKQVVLAMLGGNPEMAIAALLAQGIEGYGNQLESLQAWTNGGVDMFNEALELMFEDLAESQIDGYTLEDMFQLAIMDYVTNGGAFTPEIGHFLENAGSGMHGSPVDGVLWTGDVFASAVADIWNDLIQAPADSLCIKILDFIMDNGGMPALQNQFINNFYNDDGFVLDSNYDQDQDVSPMLRMAFLMGFIINKSTDQATIEMILTGSLSDLNSLVAADYPNSSYPPAMEFLFEHDGYDGVESNGLPSGWRPTVDPSLGPNIDWNGAYLSSDYFDNMYANFPARELTKEEIKEVNRIGDQIQMLQETLKYWLSIMRDEQLAAARNI